MPSSTLTSKGQVTLPVEIRRKLGLKPGDRLYFDLQDDGLIRVDPRGYAERTAGILKDRVAKPLTIREEKEAAADGWVEGALGGLRD
jgi:AbrB family looped-hinge helix DNA binding protein